MRHWRSEKNPTVESLGFRAQAYAGYAPQLNYKETAGEWGDDVRTGHSGFLSSATCKWKNHGLKVSCLEKKLLRHKTGLLKEFRQRAENVLYRQDVLSGKIKKQYENWGVWYNPQTESILGRTGKSYGQYLVTFSTPGGLKILADNLQCQQTRQNYMPRASCSVHGQASHNVMLSYKLQRITQMLQYNFLRFFHQANRKPGSGHSTLKVCVYYFHTGNCWCRNSSQNVFTLSKIQPRPDTRPVIRAPRIPTEMGSLNCCGRISTGIQENAFANCGLRSQQRIHTIKTNINLKQAGYKGVAYVPQTATETSIVSQGIKDLYGSRAASQFKTLFELKGNSSAHHQFQSQRTEKNIQALSPKGVGTVIASPKVRW